MSMPDSSKQTQKHTRRNQITIMNVIANIPTKTIIYGAALAATALVIALLAVSYAAGPAWAHTPDGTFPKPEPCGPGAQDVPGDPAATITSGHYAVFDGYWDSEKENLNLNLCPPSVVHTMKTVTNDDDEEVEVEVSTRTKSKVDIQKTVINIDGDDFKHTITSEDLKKYPFLEMGDANNDGTDDAVGQSVWWLKVDDESTPDVDEDSRLAMGFSAALFDSDYWYLAGGTDDRGEKPLQYEFEVIREPGTPIDRLGHVYAFDDSNPSGDDNRKTAYWDSSEIDANALPLYPGEYHHFQWVFTKPGTYVVSVQLKGHVRQANPHNAGDEGYATWKAISDNSVVTSEVRQYVFQIGSLTLNHDPVFSAKQRSVKENSAVGTAVGDPIPVYRGDNDKLTYTLFGTGHELFSATSTDGGAQIQVAGNVDYETKRSYDLTVGVSDGKDHEGNPDDSIDDTIAVRINVEDVVTYVELSNANPRAGESVTVTLTLDSRPPNMYRQAGGFDMFLTEHGNPYRIDMLIDDAKLQGTITVTKASAQTAVYTPTTTVYIQDRTSSGGHDVDIVGPTFSITWQEAE